MKRIPSDFLQTLLSTVDIVEIVSKQVPLKKSGHEYSGLCPFHEEKTPSFTVSQKKQFYHCFGCHAHGNAIDFVMKTTQQDFRQAVTLLAEGAGLPLPELGEERPPFFKEGLELMQKAANFYHRQLTEHPDAPNYLIKRGLSQSSIQLYQLGYAVTCPQAIRVIVTYRFR